MVNNVNNVIVGKPLATGGALVAPVGTALPTNETTALNVAFVAVGYVTDSGVVKSENRDSSTIIAWGGDTIAAIQKSFTTTFKLSLAEFLNGSSQALIYGSAAVTVTAATITAGTKTKVAVSAATSPHNSWVFEIRSGVAKLRIVLPNAQITEVGDVSFTDEDIAANEITLTLFPDSSGNYYYTYADDGVLA